jgi:O-antigen ligase
MDSVEKFALNSGAHGPSLLWGLAIFGFALIASFYFFSLDLAPTLFFELSLCAVATVILLLYPEFALALYVVVGDVKGDERIASLGFLDLTLLLGAILLAGIALNLLHRKRVLPMPPVFFLYIVLAALMTASLSYTPVFDAGLEKAGRFLTVTGIVIVAPFFVFDTPGAMKRFLTGYAAATFAICAYSLTRLGSSGRLVTPSNFTIGLGHIACASILLMWLGLMPGLPFAKRLLVYPILAVPVVALIGSGSRGPLIATALALLVSLFFYCRFLIDAVCLGVLGFLALPFMRIPEASLSYLGSLIHSSNAGTLLSFRGELMDSAWKLLEQHPLIGAGIQGYRYYSPNAGLYNWPHNIFIEIACELGIPAALIVCAIFGSALREALRQLKDKLSPYATLSRVAAALLFVGIVNATNTGDINSDRSTWLFVSLVFVVRGFRIQPRESANFAAVPARPLAV